VLRNPVPTSGEVRSSWSRTQPSRQQFLRLLRTGAYLAVGLGLGVGLRAYRGRADTTSNVPLSDQALMERGERAAHNVLTAPAVTRAADKASEVADVMASMAGKVVDEAHDTVEETYARFHLARDRMERAVLPRWLRRNRD
jgi:hypothetical protein